MFMADGHISSFTPDVTKSGVSPPCDVTDAPPTLSRRRFSRRSKKADRKWRERSALMSCRSGRSVLILSFQSSLLTSVFLQYWYKIERLVVRIKELIINSILTIQRTVGSERVDRHLVCVVPEHGRICGTLHGF